MELKNDVGALQISVRMDSLHSIHNEEGSENMYEQLHCHTQPFPSSRFSSQRTMRSQQ